MTAAHLVASIGWTLVEFIWQGALIGCAVALAMSLLRNARAEHRYAVACAGLVLCLVWPALELAARLAGPPDLAAQSAAIFAGGLVAGPLDEGWRAVLERSLGWIVVTWGVCAVVLALRMIAGLLWLQRAAAVEGRDPVWQARLDRMALDIGIARKVRLRIVAQLTSPVTFGCWRPVVLVPASLVSGMPLHLLEALLAHELAHIRRHDYLVNLLQNVVEALLFYHPAIWWISGRIRAERELVADTIAARQLGEPRRLALALSELERIQFSTQHLAQAANGGNLMQRIKQLVRPDTQALNWKAAVPVLGLALAALAGCTSTTPVNPFAAMPDNETTKPIARFNTCARPVYPAEALASKIEGTVTMGMLVKADGKVREAIVRQSSGNASLDETARAAIAKCSFQPGTVNGAPKEQWTEVQYVWTVG
ncbi:M56 family metallopeptidase [Massilia aurea]|uniref:M56 family metallopeptidase n=1 Tax=Massilia aurea TaxID=373040 RepID=UPI0034635BAB